MERTEKEHGEDQGGSLSILEMFGEHRSFGGDTKVSFLVETFRF